MWRSSHRPHTWCDPDAGQCLQWWSPRTPLRLCNGPLGCQDLLAPAALHGRGSKVRHNRKNDVGFGILNNVCSSNLLLCRQIATGHEWASSSLLWLGGKALADPEMKQHRKDKKEKHGGRRSSFIGVYFVCVLHSQNPGHDCLQKSAADGWASRCDAPADQTHPSGCTCSSSMGPLWWLHVPLPDRQGGQHIPHRNTCTQDRAGFHDTQWQIYLFTTWRTLVRHTQGDCGLINTYYLAKIHKRLLSCLIKAYKRCFCADKCFFKQGYFIQSYTRHLKQPWVTSELQLMKKKIQRENVIKLNVKTHGQLAPTPPPCLLDSTHRFVWWFNKRTIQSDLFNGDNPCPNPYTHNTQTYLLWKEIVKLLLHFKQGNRVIFLHCLKTYLKLYLDKVPLGLATILRQ